MDIRMPGLDGLGAPGGCSPDALAPKVVVLTTFDSDDYLYEATRAGASGFLLKSAHRSRATPYSPPRLPADCSTASSTVCLPSSRTPADLADLAELSPAERSASSGRCLSLNGQR